MMQSAALPAVNPSYNPSQPTPILQLSAELRNKIFGLLCEGTTLTWKQRSGQIRWQNSSTDPELWKVFCSEYRLLDRGEVPRMFINTSGWKKDGRPVAPGFIFACKQIYEETIKVLFFTARFDFNQNLMLRAWLRQFSNAELAKVKQVFLRGRRLSYKDMKRETKKDTPTPGIREGQWFIRHPDWEYEDDIIYLEPSKAKHLKITVD